MTESAWRPLTAMPRVCGEPLGRATMRQQAEDFQVDEVLGFAPDGAGEHLLLQIRKRDTNTNWLAGQLARYAGIPSRDVSYAGLKDRHAVTTQWFSLCLAGKPEPDWSGFNDELIEVLAVDRHQRKLRRGNLQGNRFNILLRDLEADRELLQERLLRLKQEGMPNYFGEQRFGHDYQNLSRFDELLGDGKRRRIDRHLRGLLISAVRCSRSEVADELQEAQLAERCQRLDIHPSGPMWGRGRLPVAQQAAALEQSVLAPFDAWRDRLEHLGLSQERRSLRLRLDDLAWSFEAEGSALRLGFFLPAGAFATVLLRELLDVSSPRPT
ncbi:MAG: tRNA pseudouridine(13) synthase TruD [Candidatus Thiodiazotropha sp.]